VILRFGHSAENARKLICRGMASADGWLQVRVVETQGVFLTRSSRYPSSANSTAISAFCRVPRIRWCLDNFLDRTCLGGCWFCRVGASFGKIWVVEPNPPIAYSVRRRETWGLCSREHNTHRGLSNQGNAVVAWILSMTGQVRLALACSPQPSGGKS
jgi:hypothetical protein